MTSPRPQQTAPLLNAGEPSATPPARPSRHRHRGRRAREGHKGQRSADADGSGNAPRPAAPRPSTAAARVAHTVAKRPVESEAMVVIRGGDGIAYRRSVQVFFMSDRDQFLLCRPVGNTNIEFRQTVQGGSVAGESPQQTARREAWEEIGIDLDKWAVFLCEVPPLPSPGAAADASSAERRNDAGEIVSETRRAFRYRSKAWKSVGIGGQELYPLLYRLTDAGMAQADVRGWRRGVRPEFRAVEWGALSALAEQAPPSKRVVMEAICSAVAVAAAPFLQPQGTLTTL
ncbi:NUDIX hydrolase dihydroneopterin triphosphate pyrophosphohydrolase/hydrolase [Novymonas esmeraldas]|uniref:NUDIX hydrolase dihydroneopterin triphosphate pyrophosphohydrolase/hydrolase n=1 Tax=Novymonas esmeraldas TaxID=1808958 RepID=A0AAW0F2D5_9TRYP